MKPSVKLKTSGKGEAPVLDGLNSLKRQRVYVGIPEANDTRRNVLLGKAAKLKLTKKGKLSKRAKHLIAASQSDINNAQLMYIHTNGSPVNHIPARPVIEPAITANKEAITAELQQAAAAALDGKEAQAKQFMRRAGLTGQNAAKKWFTDPRNNWAPNAPSTIRRKGSSKPLIDTAQMRNAITFVVPNA